VDSIWVPVTRYLAGLPASYDADEAYRRYRTAREATYDILIRMAPEVQALLTPQQRRQLGVTAQYLDVRILKAARSSTLGSDAMYGGIRQ
jgi:hypothetical protein